VPQQILLHPEQAVPGSLDPMLDGGFVKLTNSLLREFPRREDGSIADTEPLGSKGSDNLLPKLGTVTLHRSVNSGPWSRFAHITVPQVRTVLFIIILLRGVLGEVRCVEARSGLERLSCHGAERLDGSGWF
jgi:hypothetical protein